MTATVVNGTETIGAYVLPGGPTDITPVTQQARDMEALGLGAVYIGERYATKDLPALAGALSQATSQVRLIGAVTHIGPRHPIVLASMGQTLQALSGNRFSLGLGRGSAGRWKSYGISPPTAQMLADTATILRRLWAGERVSYDGPAGRFPDLRLIELADAVVPPPLLLAAIGPRTLRLVGESFDGTILHPLLTADAVARSAQQIRRSAESSGRDPGSVEIHAAVIVAQKGPLTETVGVRALTYLLVEGLGDAIVSANGWDPADLARIRAHPRLDGLSYSDIKGLPAAELARIAETVPPTWLVDGAATGSTEQCASRVEQYIAAGATNILLHGLGRESLPPLINALKPNLAKA